jgi:hypothetical protein
MNLLASLTCSPINLYSSDKHTFVWRAKKQRKMRPISKDLEGRGLKRPRWRGDKNSRFRRVLNVAAVVAEQGLQYLDMVMLEYKSGLSKVGCRAELVENVHESDIILLHLS